MTNKYFVFQMAIDPITSSSVNTSNNGCQNGKTVGWLVHLKITVTSNGPLAFMGLMVTRAVFVFVCLCARACRPQAKICGAEIRKNHININITSNNICFTLYLPAVQQLVVYVPFTERSIIFSSHNLLSEGVPNILRS